MKMAVFLPSHLNPLFHSPACMLAKRAYLHCLLCILWTGCWWSDSQNSNEPAV